MKYEPNKNQEMLYWIDVNPSGVFYIYILPTAQNKMMDDVNQLKINVENNSNRVVSRVLI